ncbi:MAG TPA: lycopene cyclase domain-containing protein [Actinotalea sp.]|nr:lycopene cyclase domain-containing protein [Actinotalea sp.]
MTLAYGVVLLVSIASMVLLDRRFRLVLFADRWRGGLVLAAGVGFFVVWDLVGIGLGIFFRGQTPYMSGLLVAPELPVEELGFLTFLCYLTMNLYIAWARWLDGRRAVGAGAAAGPTGGGSG